MIYKFVIHAQIRKKYTFYFKTTIKVHFVKPLTIKIKLSAKHL